MTTAAELVAAERARQDAKWGQQNHPDGTGPDEQVLAPLADILRSSHHDPRNMQVARATILARAATLATDQAAALSRAVGKNYVTWALILLEEVFEALAEDDPDKLTAELAQLAGVAQQWVDAIERRRMDELHADRADRR